MKPYHVFILLTYILWIITHIHIFHVTFLSRNMFTTNLYIALHIIIVMTRFATTCCYDVTNWAVYKHLSSQIIKWDWINLRHLETFYRKLRWSSLYIFKWICRRFFIGILLWLVYHLSLVIEPLVHICCNFHVCYVSEDAWRYWRPRYVVIRHGNISNSDGVEMRTFQWGGILNTEPSSAVLTVSQWRGAGSQ